MFLVDLSFQNGFTNELICTWTWGNEYVLWDNLVEGEVLLISKANRSLESLI